MNSPLISPVALATVRDALAGAGIVDRTEQLDFVPYPISFPRQPRDFRAHLRVNSPKRTVCHLVIGSGLEEEFVRLRSFFHDCPRLVCRPLLFQRLSDNQSALCLEHFEGVSLDRLVRRGQSTAQDWLAAVRQAQEQLAATTRPSDDAARGKEVEALTAVIEACLPSSELDRSLLRQLILPALPLSLTTSWSNGDFVARNLLVNQRGEVRLIDYEYAARTHFGACDWLRLVQFSERPPQLDRSQIPEAIKADTPSHRCYLWLHHLRQLQKVHPPMAQERLVREAVGQLFLALGETVDRTTPEGFRSYFLGHLAAEWKQIHALGIERTAWAKSADSQLLAARTALADREKQIVERTVWASSLDRELADLRSVVRQTQDDHTKAVDWARSLETNLQKARKDCAALQSQSQERTAWAKSLEQQLATARANFDKLSTEHAERTAWAQKLASELAAATAHSQKFQTEQAEAVCWAKSLEADLEKARGDFAQQAVLLDERTAWAKSLEQELATARANIEKLSTEHAERTAWAQKLASELAAATAHSQKFQTEQAEAVRWAKSLEADLEKARGDFAQQAVLLDERTAWAKSLEQELATARANIEKLSTEHAERTAWAQKLDQELATINRLAADLLRSTNAAFGPRSDAPQPLSPPASEDIPATLAWVFSEYSRLQLEIATTRREKKVATAQSSEARLHATTAESQLFRQSQTLAEAQTHLDRLLAQVQALKTDKVDREQSLAELKAILSQRENELAECSDALANTRRLLAPYESSALCRFFARHFTPGSSASGK